MRINREITCSKYSVRLGFYCYYIAHCSIALCHVFVSYPNGNIFVFVSIVKMLAHQCLCLCSQPGGHRIRFTCVAYSISLFLLFLLIFFFYSSPSLLWMAAVVWWLRGTLRMKLQTSTHLMFISSISIVEHKPKSCKWCWSKPFYGWPFTSYVNVKRFFVLMHFTR